MTRQGWCNKCEDFVTPKIHGWESSIAFIEEELCPHCGEFLHRGKTRRKYKANHPKYSEGAGWSEWESIDH